MIPQVVRTRARRHPEVLDAVVVAVLLVAVLLTPVLLASPTTGIPPTSPAEIVLTAAALAAVPLRHRRPHLALVLSVAAATVVLLLRGGETIAALGPLLTLYTVALRTDRRTTLLAWAPSAAVLTVASTVGVPAGTPWHDVFQVLPWTAAAAAIGDALRNRRAYLAEVEERAVRAERSREQEARRRVAEERMRIARELHDVLAHHIAVVTVQAGVAEHLLDTRPAAATEALGHVRRSAGAILEELADILSVLRTPGQPADDSAPAPGLARVEALVASFAAAGLAVDWSLHGQPRDLPPAVDVVAYRVLEEGLTNALKHGTGTARLSIGYGTSSLVLRVRNDVSGAPETGAVDRTDAAGSAGTGHGLLGMRERAAAVGGTLHAARSSPDSFTVEASLPLRVGVQA